MWLLSQKKMNIRKDWFSNSLLSVICIKMLQGHIEIRKFLCTYHSDFGSTSRIMKSDAICKLCEHGIILNQMGDCVIDYQGCRSMISCQISGEHDIWWNLLKHELSGWLVAFDLHFHNNMWALQCTKTYIFQYPVSLNLHQILILHTVREKTLWRARYISTLPLPGRFYQNDQIIRSFTSPKISHQSHLHFYY